MKISPIFSRAWLTLPGFALSLQLSTAFGQGNLTPPAGPPSPTMKTLDQVEARTPVDALHIPVHATKAFTIIQPGSYFLRSNIRVSENNGIAIGTNVARLDLHGFM